MSDFQAPIAHVDLRVSEIIDRTVQSVNCTRSQVFLALIDAGWDAMGPYASSAQVSTALRVLLARFGIRPS